LADQPKISGLSRLSKFLPILSWLPRYDRKWLRLDIIAGITVWGLIIPEAIAYAGLAGLPPQAGLYTIPVSLVAYAVFGTSRQMVVAGTSASAVLLASTIQDMNPIDANAYYSLAAGLILIVGLLFLVAGIFRLGFITQFLSRPVMEGFIFGLAIFVSVSQMPKLFGLTKGEGDTVQQFLHIITHIGQSNWATFAVGIGALILLFGMDRISRRIPGGLVALILGILLSSLLNLSNYGVAIVGSIPAGLPSPGLPHIGPINTWILLPGAIGIVLVVFCESLGAANAFADKHGYEIKPDQDLFAFSAANLGSGLLGGLVAGGSMSQTAVNDGAGARSEISTIIAAALGLVTVVALTSLFYSLPEAVLAALIIHAVSHLMKVAEMQRFYNLQRVEFYLGMTALLGRVPGAQGIYTDLERHPENMPIPGLVIFRLDSPLYFANAQPVRDRVKALVKESSPPARALFSTWLSMIALTSLVLRCL
jgi:high affinity sulfate transporter 1